MSYSPEESFILRFSTAEFTAICTQLIKLAQETDYMMGVMVPMQMPVLAVKNPEGFPALYPCSNIRTVTDDPDLCRKSRFYLHKRFVDGYRGQSVQLFPDAEVSPVLRGPAEFLYNFQGCASTATRDYRRQTKFDIPHIDPAGFLTNIRPTNRDEGYLEGFLASIEAMYGPFMKKVVARLEEKRTTGQPVAQPHPGA